MDCEECGIPIVIGHGNIWLKDGSICGRAYPHQKGTFYDIDDLNHLYAKISDEIGFDIDHIIHAAKYADTRVWIYHWSRRLQDDLGGLMPDKFFMYRFLMDFISCLGFAKGEIVEYEEGRWAKVKIENAYSVPLLTADVRAVVDFLEGRAGADVRWEGGERDGYITIRDSGAEEEPLETGAPTFVVPREGDFLDCERCPKCRAPTSLYVLFGWDREHALITEKPTGVRYCFHDTGGLVAVIRRIIDELGEEFGTRIVQIERDYARKLCQQHDDNGYCREFLESFPILGWGRVAEVEESEDGLDIVIENPFSEHIIAGRVWGMMEAIHERDYRLDWKVKEQGELELKLRH